MYLIKARECVNRQSFAPITQILCQNTGATHIHVQCRSVPNCYAQ